MYGGEVGKYYAVTVTVVFEAKDEADAKKGAKELVDHIWKTGADSDLPCPEEITIGDAVLLPEGQ